MDEYLKEALEIVRAQAGIREMGTQEMIEMASQIAYKLRGSMGSLDESVSIVDNTSMQPAVNPKKAIREKSIVCVLCGAQFKVLTRKHLETHGHTPESYRELCGYKKKAALVCKELVRARKDKMSSMRLWEKRTNINQDMEGGYSKEKLDELANAIVAKDEKRPKKRVKISNDVTPEAETESIASTESTE